MKNTSIFIFCALIICANIFSCSGLGKKDISENPPMIFPLPPDTARIQFLTKFSNSVDVVGEKSPFARYVFGEDKSMPIEKPYGITVHENKLYICDTRVAGIEIIDLKKRTFSYFTPGGRGVLKKPINCAFDDDGNLYVADVERKQIVIFARDLSYQGEISGKEVGKPTDISIRGNTIWICDVEMHRISVFDIKDFKFRNSFPGTQKNSPDYLYSPTNMVVSAEKIYVTDTGDAKVKIFDLSGKYLGYFGSFGKRVGQFVRPKGIAVDKNGLVYVVDAAFENVQIFNDNQKLLMYFGGKYSRPGNMWLPAGVAIDYNNMDSFKEYLYPGFTLKYLIFVTNQYGPDRISVYGFVEQQRK